MDTILRRWLIISLRVSVKGSPFPRYEVLRGTARRELAPILSLKAKVEETKVNAPFLVPILISWLILSIGLTLWCYILDRGDDRETSDCSFFCTACEEVAI